MSSGTVHVICMSIAQYTSGEEEGRYLYKFWEEDPPITVDVLELVDDRPDLYEVGTYYTLIFDISNPVREE